MLLDIRMPGMDGFEVCRRMKENASTCGVPVIFISAMSDTDEKVKGFRLGAVDYVTKPYQREELLARVHTHLELSRLRHRLEAMVEERTRSLRRSEKKLRDNLLDSISAIAAIVEARDPYTAGHQQRVAQIATAIDFPWPIAETVLQHHERLDGSGYPRGFKGQDILPEAKILAVADVVEAMTSHRPYRAGLGIDAALEEISSKRGLSFSSDVVDACVKLFRVQGFKLTGSKSPGLHSRS